MISEVIKKIRIERQLTQKDFADQLFVSTKTVSSWENGRTLPDIYTLRRISEIYQIQMNDLMSGKTSKFSIFKYKTRKLYKQSIILIKTNLFIFLVALICIISLLVLAKLYSLTPIYI